MDRIQVMRDDLENKVNNDDILKKIYFFCADICV